LSSGAAIAAAVRVSAARWNECREFVDAGKRVASSAPARPLVQCVPHLAKLPRALRFQRTPSSVDVRANGPTDASGSPEMASRLAAAVLDSFIANQTM